MSIIRNKLKAEFSQTPNSLITDNRLSSGAKVVMFYLLSLPDGWQVNNVDVMNKLDIKRQETLKGYWDELMLAGWIFRERNKDTKGKFGHFIYTLHNDLQIPTTEKPYLEPTTILPVPEKPLLRKNRTYSNTKEQEHSNTQLNNTHNPLSLTKGKEEILDLSEFDEPTQEAINNWLNHKKERRQTYKPTGLKTLLKQIRDYYSTGCNIQAAIEISIGNNWQGIVFDKGFGKVKSELTISEWPCYKCKGQMTEHTHKTITEKHICQGYNKKWYYCGTCKKPRYDKREWVEPIKDNIIGDFVH